MRILLCSVPFRPSTGGVETVSALLADAFHSLGHEVIVVTQTPANEPDEAPYPVLRRPSPLALLRAVRQADIVLHNNISLRLAWPLLLQPRPWVIAHHMWIPRFGPGAVAGRLKHFASRFADNIAVSTAMAASLSVDSTVIPNPYADDVFRADLPPAPKSDLVFLGRLIPDKGLDVLLDSLSLLKARSIRPTLTIIGRGSDEERARARVSALALDSQVRFAGLLRSRALAVALCSHRVLVVPSTWEEPFGVVALEGMACGLVPIVARSGGLPDAVGACGLVVEKSDAGALASAIERLLSDEALIRTFRAAAPAHLGQHTRERIAHRYLSVLVRAVELHYGAAHA
jgi:glycosyltransferase involved in cell wall biosynthesis